MLTALSLSDMADDEDAVDLDLVDRQRAQPGQRRIAGAEVVEADAHAHLAQRVSVRVASSTWLVAIRSVISSSSSCGSSWCRSSIVAMIGDQLVADEVAGGDVDGDGQVDAESRQATACAIASSTTRAVSSGMTPERSASGMKWSGGMKPRTGCRHRTRASRPSGRESPAATLGW